MNNDLISRSALKEFINNGRVCDICPDKKINCAIHCDFPDTLTPLWEKVIDNAPTIDTYTEDDVQYAIKEGHQVGYEMAKAKFERPQGGFTIDELKLWLYEIVSNNDNEFGTDCLEIIDRLDGFLNFVSDMRKEAKGESL